MRSDMDSPTEREPVTDELAAIMARNQEWLRSNVYEEVMDGWVFSDRDVLLTMTLRYRAMLEDVARELELRAANPSLATFDQAATIRRWLADPGSFDQARALLGEIDAAVASKGRSS